MGYKVGKSYCNRGKEYSLTGNFKKAKDDYTRSIEHGYDSYIVYMGRGAANLDLEEYNEAILDLTRQSN